jgi:hypothetical protein
VPTQPVFSHRNDGLAASPPEVVTAEGRLAPRSAAAGTASEPGVAEQLPDQPAEGSRKTPDQKTPGTLAIAGSVPPSWVFSPRISDAEIKKGEPSVEVKTDPAAKSPAQGATR